MNAYQQKMENEWNENFSRFGDMAKYLHVNYVQFWQGSFVRIARGAGSGNSWGSGWEYENVSAEKAQEILRFIQKENPDCNVRGDAKTYPWLKASSFSLAG